jgi:plasmid replication initiation protein
MGWDNPKFVDARIKRLTKEISEIEEVLYGFANQDRMEIAALLEGKRDDMVRAAVLQIHTQIDDYLTQVILYCVLNITDTKYKHRLRGDKARAFRRLLYGGGSIGFDTKLNLAVGLGLVSEGLRKKLMELNTLRNKCSHNWQLRKVVRRGKKPTQKKPPLLLFRERNLHDVAVLKDFVGEYVAIYLRLYLRWTQ